MYTITKYYTNSCPSCKTLTVLLNGIEERLDMQGELQVKEVNCEDVPEAFVSKMQIVGVPTVVLTFLGGTFYREVARFTGPKTKSDLDSWVITAIAKDKETYNNA